MKWNDLYDFCYNLEAGIFTEYATADNPTPAWHWTVSCTRRAMVTGSEPTYEEAKQAAERVLKVYAQELLDEIS